MKHGRYETVGRFFERKRTDVDVNGRTVSVITEASDIVDTSDNHRRYEDGAMRVRATRTVPGKHSKTFWGETAWSWAENLHDDMVRALRMEGH